MVRRDRQQVRDSGRCRICGRPGTEIDHIADSTSDLDNLQLLCSDCHRAKTAESLRPASTQQSALLHALFLTRVAPEEPTLLADDDVQWQGVWRRLKSARKQRFTDRLVDMGLDIGGLTTRAEMVVAFHDALSPRT